MGRLLNIAINKMLDYLASEGDRLAKLALRDKEALNVTYNQADAFGYVVFYNKVLKRKGYAEPTPTSNIVHKGWAAIDVQAGTGREWLDEFIGTWKPESNGFVLAVVNAAFYSSILEQGRQSKIGTKYRIISQIWGEMEDIQKTFKGSKITLKIAYSR